MPIDGPDAEDRSVLTRPAGPPTSTWSYGPDRDQVADIYLPASPSMRPLVLVHGGFWRPAYDRRHLRPLAEALRDIGHLVVSLEYRRRPGDPDSARDDIGAALLRLQGDPPEGCPAGPPAVIGHSAGGHLALLVASDQTMRVAGVVALAPVADLRLADDLGLDGGAVRAFLGANPSSRPDLDPAALPAPSIPVTIIHGDRDAIVPVAVSRSYMAAVGSHVRLVELADTGHFELIDPRSPAFAELLTAADATGIE